MQTTFSRENTPLRKTLRRLLQYFVLSILTLVVVVPVVLIVIGGLKTRGEFASHPYSLPIPPYWDNYIDILNTPQFWTMMRNSLMVMTATTVSVVFLCGLAAFVFARMQFRGKGVLFNLFTVGLMFPINVAILPVYLVIRQMDMTNQLLAIIWVQTAFQLSGNIVILRGFFMAIPNELQDAAYIDGCTTFGFFWRILLPLAKPSLAAVAALTMIVSWNDLLVPLVLIDKESLWTLPLGTMQFQGQYSSDMAKIAAFLSLSAIPTIVFYMFAERQIVAGLTAGALKG